MFLAVSGHTIQLRGNNGWSFRLGNPWRAFPFPTVHGLDALLRLFCVRAVRGCLADADQSQAAAQGPRRAPRCARLAPSNRASTRWTLAMATESLSLPRGTSMSHSHPPRRHPPHPFANSSNRPGNDDRERLLRDRRGAKALRRPVDVHSVLCPGDVQYAPQMIQTALWGHRRDTRCSTQSARRAEVVFIVVFYSLQQISTSCSASSRAETTTSVTTWLRDCVRAASSRPRWHMTS